MSKEIEQEIRKQRIEHINEYIKFTINKLNSNHLELRLRNFQETLNSKTFCNLDNVYDDYIKIYREFGLLKERFNNTDIDFLHILAENCITITNEDIEIHKEWKKENEQK